MEILVEGCAERQVWPELGELQLGLEHEGDDREFVVDLTSDLARRFSGTVVPLHPRAVASWGLEPVRVCTWRSQRRGALRYRASVEATVVFRDFQVLTGLAVGWGAAPGVKVRRTSWKLTPETEQKLEDELLTEAVRAARRRADTIARVAGAEVNVCVELSDRRSDPQFAYDEAVAMVATAPEGRGGVVEPDEIRRVASVHGRFRTERTMVDAALARARLVSQGLVLHRWERPVEVAAAFGVHQGQDLPGVPASIASRSDGGIDAVLGACARGEIVRGYPMRGTVFLMAAADARWITQLCADKSLWESTRILKGRGVGEGHLERAAEIASELLADGPRSRAELYACWVETGLSEVQGANYHMTFQYIAIGTPCYGPVVDGDQYVALTESWLPTGTGLEDRFNGDRGAACAKLSDRYPTSCGPAALRDFSWWSKLPLGTVRQAFALIREGFEELPGDEPRYQRVGLADEVVVAGRSASRPLPLLGFDEFILGYQDRLFALTERDHPKLVPDNNGMFKRGAVLGGRVAGLRKRAGTPDRRRLELTRFEDLSSRAESGFEKAFQAWPFLTE